MSNLKKVLALVLALALCLTMFAGAIETVLPFGDTDELTAEQLKALELTYALGVFKGDGENINPADTFTRAQLAAVLYRLYTADAEEKYVSTYTNVAEAFADCDDAWYTPYINWAFVKGVIAGYGDGNFGPNDAVTGVQAATMMARLLGYEVAGDNWELTARKIAIENGLDDGIASKDLFGTELTVGDMIVMVANTLNAKAVGAKATMAEEIFDLEIVEGAILLGADKLGSTPYSVFAFKDEIAGNVKYFIADLLSIEEKPTTDEIGQKYTLYVAKTEEVNGYKVLYAAYEEAENAYYNVVTGTVNDKALNVTDDTKADYLGKKLDKFCVVYVDGVAGYTFADFAAAYGKLNYATYKLIDNDGDGLYEYIFIERATFAALGVTEIVANVVSYNKGAYTLSNGETYIFGQYYDVNAKGVITGLVNAADAGVGLIGEKGHTASSVQYKFYVVGDYIMKVEVCDDTYFAGDYVLGMSVLTEADDGYKMMPYVQFLNENNEYVNYYVAKVNHVAAANYFGEYEGNFAEEMFYVNAYGDDTVELFTVPYINSHAAYAYLNGNFEFDESFAVRETVGKFLVVDEVPAVWGDAREANHKFSKANLYQIELAGEWKPIFFASETIFKAQLATHTGCAVRYLDAASIPAEYVQVDVVINYTTTDNQIFKAHGVWYLQNYADKNVYTYDVFFTYKGETKQVVYEADEYAYYIAGTDTVYSTGANTAAGAYAVVAAEIDAFVSAYTTEFIWGAPVALNTSKGVVFAYGQYKYNTAIGNTYTWRAYNLDEFNAAFYGNGGMNDDKAGVIDELVFANSNGTMYVKAMKVTAAENDTLPLGWMVENSDIFVLANDGVEMYDINGRNVQAIYPNGVVKYVYIPYGIGFAKGDIVYAIKDEAGNYVSFEKIGNFFEVAQEFPAGSEILNGIAITADGVVTRTHVYGITYTTALNLEKTFFMYGGEYVDCATFAAKQAAIGFSFTIVNTASGYTFVY